MITTLNDVYLDIQQNGVYMEIKSIYWSDFYYI